LRTLTRPRRLQWVLTMPKSLKRFILLVLSLLAVGTLVLIPFSYSKTLEWEFSDDGTNAKAIRISNGSIFFVYGLTPYEILRNTAAAYSGCSTYRDSGTMEIKIMSKGPYFNAEPKTTFSTRFSRNGQYRFVFQRKACNPYIIWRQGDYVRAGYMPSDGKKEESIGMAVTRATGISYGLAHNIAAFLMPSDVSGRFLTLIENRRRISDAKQNGQDCFRVCGLYGSSQATLWIDKKSFLIVRLDFFEEDSQCSRETKIIYHPTVNQEIPAKDFEFEGEDLVLRK
jgi:hypothetical protein